MPPSSGIIHALGHNWLGKADIAVQTILLCGGIVVVALRLWSRRLLGVFWQWNDWLILVSLVRVCCVTIWSWTVSLGKYGLLTVLLDYYGGPLYSWAYADFDVRLGLAYYWSDSAWRGWDICTLWQGKDYNYMGFLVDWADCFSSHMLVIFYGSQLWPLFNFQSYTITSASFSIESLCGWHIWLLLSAQPSGLEVYSRLLLSVHQHRSFG